MQTKTDRLVHGFAIANTHLMTIHDEVEANEC
jgi:hypothetical protein